MVWRAEMIDSIRKTAGRWLEDGTVDAFVGFRKREDGSVVPTRIRKAADVRALVFDDGCVHNLMSYVDLNGEDKIGLLLKGCDGRALVQLLTEGELSRERVKVLGVVCPGLSSDGALEPKCEICRVNVPPVYDELVADGGAEPWEKEPVLEDVAAVESKPHPDRAAYFKGEFDRCIRCYACRDICPLCYCEECVTEKSRPQWVEEGIKPSSNAYWHLIRAYHLAGRCVECGECDRACPVDIPLRVLNRKMAATVEGLFGYVPGIDPEATPVLLEFKEDEEHVLCPGDQS
jgi:formate dehydrogenase subunit beta